MKRWTKLRLLKAVVLHEEMLVLVVHRQVVRLARLAVDLKKKRTIVVD